jgi:hypothetical protein
MAIVVYGIRHTLAQHQQFQIGYENRSNPVQKGNAV